MSTKNGKQKVVAIVLALIMVLGGIGTPLEVVYATQSFDFGGGVTGALENGTLTVSKTDPNETGRMKDFAENESPLKDENISKLIINEGVKSIGNSTFMCNQLTSITIPESVYEIGNHAFHNNELELVTIPESVKTIAEESFSDNGSLELIIVPEGVEIIGQRAFANCDLDDSVTIPESVYKIDSGAFTNNYISKITIGSDVDIADDEGERWDQDKTTGNRIGFKNVYDDSGKQAGTYVFDYSEWKWQKKDAYTVTYNDNGSTERTVPSFTEYYTEDETATVLGNIGNLTKRGYIFTGWNTEADGSGTFYGVHRSFKMGTENITLYAMWSENSLLGDGSAENPYEIHTSEDLILVSEIVKSENKLYGDKHYKLINDIDLVGKQWTPIGENFDNSFKGVFDGNNKKIKNMSIGTEQSYNTEFGYMGLFGCIDGATIKDVDLLEVSIYTKNNNERYLHIGGLVGYISWKHQSSINNVTVSGDINCDDINRVDLGGLAGRVQTADIENSKSEVNISGGKGNTGGFIGEFSGKGKVDNCQATGSVQDIGDESSVGGFIGINGVTILNSLATGDVTATGADSNVAGFAGVNQGSSDTIINSYATGDVIGGNNSDIGGFVGENRKLIINSYATGNVNGGAGSFVGGFAGINIGSEYGDNGELMYTYNNENITTTAIGCIEEGSIVENSFPIPEAKMKAVAGEADALVDILNHNRENKERYYWNKVNKMIESNGGELIEWSEWENFKESQGFPESDEWNEWAVIPSMNNGFPIFAKTVPAKHDVIFNSNGGSEVSDQEVYNGEKVTEPVKCERSGYLFKGWYKDEALTSEWNFEEDVVKENMTLYAKWERISSGRSSGGSSGGGSSEKSPDSEAPVIVIVNGKEENAGKETRKEENGKKVIEVVAKPEVMKEKIEEALKNKKEGEENIVVVPVSDTTAEITRVALTGEIVKKMEDHDFTFSVDKKNIQYNIPAKEFTIEAVAEKLKVDEKQLREIEVEVQISKVSDETIKKYEKIAKERTNEIIVPPVDFDIVAKTKRTDGETETVNISRFNSYVERVIEIPEGIDPSKITTGIVFNLDGSYSHVPTEVFKKKGKYYAKLNSLTNSTYSIIWNPVTVEAVEGHWAEEEVNDMASRLVVVDVEDFMPEKAINRGEFANYIVRALGLYREEFQFSEERKMFLDVNKSHPSFTGIAIASEWGIVNGYPDGTFKPDNTITREEAMTMYEKAMDIVKLIQVDKDRILSYEDRSKVAPWAYEAVKKTLGAGVFNGRTQDKIAPKGTFTCAEAATAIRNLLIEAGLINE